MASAGSTVRKDLRDLNRPMEVRELNRQLEWLWKQLLGGLSDRSFSSDGITKVTTISENRITESVTSGSVETNALYAALSALMVAKIGVADIDYAKIMDLIAEEAIFSNGTAGQLYINRLAVTQANLLNATINRLVMPGGDGKYYAIVVGADGVLHTEEVTVTAGEIAAGELGDGRQISATTINAGDINGETVNAQSAIINTILTAALTAGKITAGEALIASATIPTLYTTSVEAIGNSLTFSANGTISALAEQIDLRVLKGELETYLRLIEAGVQIGKSNSPYNVLIDDDSVDIVQSGTVIATFAFNKLWTQAAEVDKYVKIGGATLEWSATTGFSLDV